MGRGLAGRGGLVCLTLLTGTVPAGARYHGHRVAAAIRAGHTHERCRGFGGAVWFTEFTGGRPAEAPNGVMWFTDLAHGLLATITIS